MCAESPTRKTCPPTELVGDLFVGLPRGDLDEVDVQPLADCLGEQLAATLWCELVGRLALAGEIRGDEHAQIALYHQENAVDVGVFDMHGIAVGQVRDELRPGCPEVDEDHVDGQRTVARRADPQRFPDRTVHAVRADEVVGADGLGLPRVPVAQHRGDAGVVLLKGGKFGTVSHFPAVPAGFGEQDRLEPALGAVLRRGLRAELAQAGEDRVDVDGRSFLRAVERGLDNHGRNVVGDRVYFVAEPKAPQDLQGAEAQIAGFRVDEHLAPLFDQQRPDAVLGKQRRGGEAGRTGAHDEDGNTLFGHARMIVTSK